MHRIARRSAFTALAASSVAMFVGVGGAFAHIAPSPIAIEAGAKATITFNVEHGCAGSNTVRLDIKMPDGVTDATPVTKSGWTASSTNGVVTFAGGNLDAKTPDTFGITFTAPSTAGEINFPIVQKCVAGETDWIQIQQDGQPEPANPAAQVKVTSGPPTSADLVVVPDDDDDATAATVAGGTSATAAPTITIAAPSTSGKTSKDDSSNAPVIIAIVAGVVVIAGVGGYLAIRKKGPKPS